MKVLTVMALLVAAPAFAIEDFAREIERKLGAPTVNCLVCHNAYPGDGATRSFAVSLRARGLVKDSVTSLDAALVKLEADQVDSDNDGMLDIDELRAGRNPSVVDAVESADGGTSPSPTPVPTIVQPHYGCGASSVPGILVTALPLLALIRRRRKTDSD